MAKYHQKQGRGLFEEEYTKQALAEMDNLSDLLLQVVGI